MAQQGLATRTSSPARLPSSRSRASATPWRKAGSQKAGGWHVVRLTDGSEATDPALTATEHFSGEGQGSRGAVVPGALCRGSRRSRV